MAPVVMEWESHLGRRLRVRDLHILATVVKSGGMAKAARQLAMTQPSVSAAIARSTMHIPDGFLTTDVALACAVPAAVCVGIGLKRANVELDERRVPLLGVTAAFIFAAQMCERQGDVGDVVGHETCRGGVLLQRTVFLQFTLIADDQTGAKSR